MSPYRPPIRTAVVRPPPPGAPPRVVCPPRPAPTPQMPPMHECLRIARVAQVLDVSRKRIYQLIEEGRLDVIRVGPRQTRVLKRSLDEFVNRLLKERADERG